MLNIIEKRKIWFIISGTLVGLSWLFLLLWGLKPGIDFTGGSLLEVDFTGGRPTSEELKNSLSEVNLGTLIPQPTEETGYLLKTRFISEEEHQQILTKLRTSFENENNKVIEKRIETIGPAVSSVLRQRAIGSTIAVVIAIGLYIAYTFRKVSKPVKSWKYGISAIVALIHDVSITAGVFAILGHFFNVEVDIAFVVALLTILGYSVNDTIVVFDRARENLIKFGSENFEETINKGIIQTFWRSVNTSFTVLLVLCAMYFFGGSSVHYFSLALIVGIFFGTYSSIFLASPLLVSWHKFGNR